MDFYVDFLVELFVVKFVVKWFVVGMCVYVGVKVRSVVECFVVLLIDVWFGCCVSKLVMS